MEARCSWEPNPRTYAHLEKLVRAQRAMERIGGFKAEHLAARREAALIALTLKLLDGDCREGFNCVITLLYCTVWPWNSRTVKKTAEEPDFSDRITPKRVKIVEPRTLTENSQLQSRLTCRQFWFRGGCQWSKFGGTNDFESSR